MLTDRPAPRPELVGEGLVADDLIEHSEPLVLGMLGQGAAASNRKLSSALPTSRRNILIVNRSLFAGTGRV